MMNTVDILNTRISLCLNIKAKSYHTITLFDALNSIRIGTYSNTESTIPPNECASGVVPHQPALQVKIRGRATADPVSFRVGP